MKGSLLSPIRFKQQIRFDWERLLEQQFARRFESANSLRFDHIASIRIDNFLGSGRRVGPPLLTQYCNSPWFLYACQSRDNLAAIADIRKGGVQKAIDSIEGFILAGGESRRMGRDKARLVLGGKTFLERIVAELAPVVVSVGIVGSFRDDDFAVNGRPLQVVPDVFERWGALGGLHAALSATRTDWALIVACDMPFVTRDLFLHLAGLREDYDSVAPLQADGRPQPLCGLYRAERCRPATEKLIKVGERRPVTLLQSLRTRWVAFAELAGMEGANRFFANVNTPEDYARAQRDEPLS